MRTLTRLLAALLILAWAGEPARASDPLRALIVDGQNNHDWRATTPVLSAALSEGDLFHVDVATSPESGDLSGFAPAFADYDVVVLNYNGALWSEAAQQGLVQYVHGGGGLAVIHAANNSFPEWPEYNEMIGLGGWGGRSEKSGPYIRFRDGQFVRDETPGAGGSHGAQHPFQVVIRDMEHPIVAGLPAAWMHATDELYDRLRGPALNLHVLATAYAAPDQGGTGEHEPMIMTIDYGDGRVFHTPMGHSADAMRCVGFQVVLRRGCEWAATGDVQHTEIPQDFPTADEVRQRQ